MFHESGMMTLGEECQNNDVWMKIMKSFENGNGRQKVRVLIIGGSLLTNGVLRLLKEDQRFMVLGCVETVDEALQAMGNGAVDALVVMGTDNQTTMRVCPVIAQYPEIPILRADISQNHIQLVTSQNIEANPDNLLTVLAALPRRA